MGKSKLNNKDMKIANYGRQIDESAHKEMMPLYHALIGSTESNVNITGQPMKVFSLRKSVAFALPPQAAGSESETLITGRPGVSTANVSVKLANASVQTVTMVQNNPGYGVEGYYPCDDAAGPTLFGRSPVDGEHFSGELVAAASKKTYLCAPLRASDGSVGVQIHARNYGETVGYPFVPQGPLPLDISVDVEFDSAPDVGSTFGIEFYDGSSTVLAFSEVAFPGGPAIRTTLTSTLTTAITHFKVYISGAPGKPLRGSLSRVSILMENSSGSDVDVDILSDRLYLGYSASEVADLVALTGSHRLVMLGSAHWVVGDPTMEQRGRIYGGTGTMQAVNKQFMTKADMMAILPDRDTDNYQINKGCIIVGTPRNRAAYGSPISIGDFAPHWTTNYFSLTSGGSGNMHVVVQFQCTIAAVPINAWLAKPGDVPFMGQGVDCLFHFLGTWWPVFENSSHRSEFKKRFVKAIKRVPGYVEGTTRFLQRAAPIVGSLAALL